MRSIRFVLIVALILLGSRAYATTPSQFSVQGVLRDSGGKLQSMMVNVTVNLYSASTGGAPLSTPVNALSVMAVNGLFTVTITADQALQTVLATPPIWLELVVGNDTFPRQLITADVYALQCGAADVANSLAPSVTINAATQITGVLPVANGGTGAGGVEAWHEIPDSALAFGWVWYSTPTADFTTPAFYKNPFGEVRLKGLIRNGTAVGTIYQLPAGYAPAHTTIISTTGNTTAPALCTIYIYNTGNIQLQSNCPTGAGNWVSLDGITFRAGS